MEPLSVNPVAARLDSGTAVGPYVVERQLAQGGMSVLYVARDADGGRVVLKMVSPELATAAARTRLLREARALSLVDHPGVVKVHGTGEHHGMPWIAMDLVQGTDLKHVIAEFGHLPTETALRYAIQAAEALVAAHDAGVVHRDLKPSNVLVTADGRIVLVDFGIAKRRTDSREGDELTSAREVLGTPAYLSPEQLDHGLADERSDIWTLGCVLYEMVVGAPPFGRGGSATTAAILRDEPAFPPRIPADVAHVISACLRKNWFARIASPRELLALLRDVRDRPGSEDAPPAARPSSSTRPTSGRSRSSAPPKGELPLPSSTPKPAPISRSSASPTRRPPSAAPPPSTRPPSAAPPPSTRPPSAAPPAPTRRPSSAAPPQPTRRPPSAPPAVPSVRAATARGHIKGTAIRAAIVWFGEVYGSAALDRVVERCSLEPGATIREPTFGVMASGWYDTRRVGEFLRAMEQVAEPANSAQFATELGAAIARDNVAGVYRALFRLIASPSLLEANAQRVWQTYCDEGTLAVRISHPTSFDATVRAWPHHDEAICRMIAPVAEHALRMLGYGSVTVERWSCLAQGGSQCAFQGNWAP
jgi:serine/threonine protein kinase